MSEVNKMFEQEKECEAYGWAKNTFEREYMIFDVQSLISNKKDH